MLWAQPAWRAAGSSRGRGLERVSEVDACGTPPPRHTFGENPISLFCLLPLLPSLQDTALWYISELSHGCSQLLPRDRLLALLSHAVLCS